MAAPGLAAVISEILQGLNNPDIPGNVSTSSIVTNNTEDLKAQDTKGIFIDDRPGEVYSIWTDFRVVNYFEYDMRRYMGAITSPTGFQGDTVAFYQLGAPTLLWISRWTACRIHHGPVIPNPDKLNDTDWVVLDKQYEPMHLIMMRDGVTPLYRISGMFSFGHRKPDRFGNILTLMNYSRPPWVPNDQRAPRNVRYWTPQQSDVIDAEGQDFEGVAPGQPGPPSS